MARKPLSAETIAKLRQRGRDQYSSLAARRAHGDLTLAKMAALALYRAAVARLRDAWALATPAARQTFQRQLFASCAASASREPTVRGDA